jgi:hypothetical protein
MAKPKTSKTKSRKLKSPKPLPSDLFKGEPSKPKTGTPDLKPFLVPKS